MEVYCGQWVQSKEKQQMENDMCHHSGRVVSPKTWQSNWSRDGGINGTFLAKTSEAF